MTIRAIFQLISNKDHNHRLLYDSIDGNVKGQLNPLLTLDGPVYVTNKEQRGTETHCPEHQEESIADASHVTKEERGLHKTRHI